jgi:type II secretory pathway predicted ATPase ExeA
MTLSLSQERRPFLLAPSAERYFAASAIEEARQRIVRAISRNEGPAILVGGAGTGKSLLLAVLARQFKSRLSVVTLAGAQLCTRRALLQMILCELGLPYRAMDEGELRLAILEHLRGGAAKGRGQAPFAQKTPQNEPVPGPRRLLLLVDEADALPTRLLEELRVLTNVAADGMPLVSLVLAGGPILEERFADPKLDMFAQRIAARCYLAPLGREETLLYVRSQVAAVGVKPERLFTADALEAIHSATGGVPRVINQLGDQLAWMAEETGCAPLDASLVQQAWSELQQLPAPWNTVGDSGPASSESGGVIEFGELDGPSDAVLETVRPVSAATTCIAIEELDDDMPASIPIATARPGRPAPEVEAFEATLDATEQLLESFDQFEELEIRDPDPALHVESTVKIERNAAAAEDPFGAFDYEEVVIDPYAEFESELLRTAPQVVNRMDQGFAGELHRCVQRAAAKPQGGSGGVASDVSVTILPGAMVSEVRRRDHGLSPTSLAAIVAQEKRSAPDKKHVHEDEDMSPEPKMVVPLTNAPAAAQSGPRDLLVIEDDDRSTATIVPGKQFRRLFSTLETSGRSFG